MESNNNNNDPWVNTGILIANFDTQLAAHIEGNAGQTTYTRHESSTMAPAQTGT